MNVINVHGQLLRVEESPGTVIHNGILCMWMALGCTCRGGTPPRLQIRRLLNAKVLFHSRNTNLRPTQLPQARVQPNLPIRRIAVTAWAHLVKAGRRILTPVYRHKSPQVTDALELHPLYLLSMSHRIHLVYQLRLNPYARRPNNIPLLHPRPRRHYLPISLHRTITPIHQMPHLPYQ